MSVFVKSFLRDNFTSRAPIITVLQHYLTEDREIHIISIVLEETCRDISVGNLIISMSNQFLKDLFRMSKKDLPAPVFLASPSVLPNWDQTVRRVGEVCLPSWRSTIKVGGALSKKLAEKPNDLDAKNIQDYIRKKKSIPRKTKDRERTKKGGKSRRRRRTRKWSSSFKAS